MGEEKTNETYSFELLEPYNPTDLVVYHDASQALYVHAIMDAKENNRSHAALNPIINDGDSPDATLSYGKYAPIITIYGRQLDPDNILDCMIDISGIKPTIVLTVIDNSGEFFNISSIPNPDSVNNYINVIIVPGVNKAFRNMMFRFKITSQEPHIPLCVGADRINILTQGHRRFLRVTGEYYIPNLDSQTIEQIRYNNCEGERCAPFYDVYDEEDKQLNTWGAFHCLAHSLGVGFAATDDCITIKDFLPPIRRESIYDYIRNRLTYAGTNSEEIMDAWFDEYLSLNLCNIGKFFGNANDIKFNSLVMNKVMGPMWTDPEIQQPQIKETLRLISNYNGNPEYAKNTSFDFYSFISTDVTPEHQNTQLYICGANGNVMEETGQEANYSFTQTDIEPESTLDIGLESSDKITSEQITSIPSNIKVCREVNDYAVNLQKSIIDTKLKKITGEKLYVRLNEINHDIHRGQLINVLLFTDDPKEKLRLYNMYKAAGAQVPAYYQLEGNIDNDTMLPIIERNGIYYINSVTYIYSPYNTIDYPGVHDSKLVEEHEILNRDFLNAYQNPNSQLSEITILRKYGKHNIMQYLELIPLYNTMAIHDTSIAELQSIATQMFDSNQNDQYEGTNTEASENQPIYTSYKSGADETPISIN